ncbi:uncharacterized protein LOC129558974 [Moschus berezovskii]|uniref:uncharacterized protein LOC129558974 n=1 Tax=Moschus berezovskii TaxID=68408 RepID=UPI00244406CE|nr:uncharacterized protein LOC129558974 [Moschus berezovskii]
MILLLVTYSPIAHSHLPPHPTTSSFCDRSPRQAQAGAQRRRVTKPPPAAAAGCGAARLPAAPRLRRASKFVSAPAPLSLHTPSGEGGSKKKGPRWYCRRVQRQAVEGRGSRQRERETGRRKKRTWRETERVQEAARSERQGTGGSPRLDARLSGPAALGPWTGSLGGQKPEPAHLCPTRRSPRTSSLWQLTCSDTSYYSPGSFGKRMAVSGSLSSLWKISLKLVFTDGYKQIPRSESVRTDAHQSQRKTSL